MIFLLKRQNGQHLQKGDIKVLIIWVQPKAVGNGLELLKILTFAQEKLDRVKCLQEQMFIGLLTAQNLNKELVPIFLDAELQTLGVFKELRKDGIGITQSSSINAIVLQAILHQVVQPLEQL
jgi:hypothetical protein